MRRTREVVTLGVERPPPLELTGRHVSPREFHGMLEESLRRTTAPGGLSSAEQQQQERPLPPVLIDVRNLYETRLGRFVVAAPPPAADGAEEEAAGPAPAAVETLDPMTRQFSDFPAWVRANAERLRRRRVLMYCTGGVRCERASALVRAALAEGGGCEGGGGDAGDSPGAAAAASTAETEVVQLRGGIQRYLEEFPDGGFFRVRGTRTQASAHWQATSAAEQSFLSFGAALAFAFGAGLELRL